MDMRHARPDGRLHPGEALALGTGLLLIGLVHLALLSDPLASLVTAVIAATYLLVYTPLKPVTPLCSIVGAVPGALPPVVGWAAARGGIGAEPWVLFSIMFLWRSRTPSRSAGCTARTTRAGIRVLPIVDRDGPAPGHTP